MYISCSMRLIIHVILAAPTLSSKFLHSAVSTTRSLCYRLPSLWNKMSFEYVKNIQQAAVFKGASTGASVYTAIVLLAQISVSFSMQQGRKYHLGKLLRCMVIWLYCLSVCLGLSILEGNPAEFICRVANLETSLWRVWRPDGTYQPIAQGGVLYSQYREKFKLEILSESSGSNTSYLQTLTLNEATVDDDGEYRCEEEGQIRSWSSLTVESPGLAILEGNPAKFSCRVANLETSLWRVQRPDGTLQAFAQGGVLYSHYRDKFLLEILTESSGISTSYLQTLTLNEATVDDDGEYRCEEEGQIRSWTSLTVESTPVLHLKINNNTVTTSNINVVLNQEVAVDCIAEGGKPPVTLSWRVNGEEKNLLIDNPPSSPEKATSTIHLFPTMGDKTLTCVATGQKVTPQTNVSVVLNIQYLSCSLGVVNTPSEHDLTCSCDANPDEVTYKIYVNGSSHTSQKTVKLPCDEPADVFCKASNGAVTSRTKEEFLRRFCFGSNKEKGAQVGLIIAIIIAIIAVTLASIVAAVSIWVYKKCKNEAEKQKYKINLQLRVQWKRKQDHKTKGPDSEGTETENGETPRPERHNTV